MKSKLLSIAIITLAGCVSGNAQELNPRYYGFEQGNIAQNANQKNSANWWMQSNDVFSISDAQNHTKDGKRSLKYTSATSNDKGKFASTIYAQSAIKLSDGKYVAKMWVYVESGSLSNFNVALIESKIKDGKRLAYNSTETPDFVSPYYSAIVKAQKVQKAGSGKWVELTSMPFRNKESNKIDKVDTILQIFMPKDSEAVTFYIDDIKIEKISD